MARRAWQVTVYEQAAVYWSAGAGIVITANGDRALKELGLASTVSDVGHQLRFTGIRDEAGRTLLTPRSTSFTWAIHRPALHAALLEAAAEHAELQMGARVTGLDVGRRDREAARVTWTDVEGEHVTEAELVVNAQGARDSFSAAIRQGATSRPSGFAAWRALINDSDTIGSDWRTWWGPDLEFSIIRVDPETVSWHALFPVAPGEDGPRHILDRLSTWPDRAARFASTTPTDRMFRHDLPVLDATPTSFSTGRAILVGDAAHPLLPTVHQGANLALEDAVTLGRLLVPGVPLQRGFRAYDRHRIPRVRAVDRIARRLARFGAGCPGELEQKARDRALQGIPGCFLARSLNTLPAWSGAPGTAESVGE